MPAEKTPHRVDLLFGADQKAISANIRALRRQGIPENQAQAQAYAQARRSGHRRRRNV